VAVGLFSQVTGDRTLGNGLRFRKAIRKTFSWKGLSSVATGCPGNWLSHHPWRDLKELEMSCLGTRFSGGLDSASLTVELDDHKSLF